MAKKVILQGSLLSHLDHKVYSAAEIVSLALRCQKEGACMVHVHLYKLGGIRQFLEMARRLEALNGPMLNISVSDFKALTDPKAERPHNIVSAAMHGGSCTVFGTPIQQSYEQAEAEMAQYLETGMVPEVSIFNWEGVNNCVKLNQKYGRRFFVGAYLGYPGGMEATKQNILQVADRLKECWFCSFVLYNNQNDELYRYILHCGGHLRSGMEDNLYCGDRLADDCPAHMRHLSAIIRACGMEADRGFFAGRE